MWKINIISLNYFLNGFFPTILMFIYFLNNEKIKASEIGILSSLIIVLLSIFSSNKRNLILSQQSNNLFNETLLFRIIFFIPIFLFYLIYLFYFEMINSFNLGIFFLFFSLWINEILLVKEEIDKNVKKIYLNIFLFFLYFIFIQIQFIKNLNYFEIVNLCLTIFLLTPAIKYFFKLIKKTIGLNISKMKKALNNNIFSLSFISSFSFLLSVFIWRFFLIEYLGPEIAIYYFIIFAIASFPGTFVNNFLGISILKNNKKKFKNYYLIISILIIFLLFLANTSEFKYYIFNKNIIFDLEVLSSTITYSLIGSLVMILGMYFRLLMFFNKKKINTLFKSDFYYGIIITLIVPFLCFFIINYIYLSYFIGSVFSLIYYFSIYKIYFKNL